MDKNSESDILVTITTVSYNSEHTIRKAIESVLNQTYSRVEYIIKDGGSSDDTIKIANSYAEKFKKKGYLFKVISSKDSGMYDALNTANEIASGEIIGNVNSDDFFEDDAVFSMVDEYKRSKFDMAYADLRIIKGNKSRIKIAKLRNFISSRHWNHPTTFIKRSVLLKEKYKCESMYDDFDLMLRIRRNYKVVIIHKVLSNFVFGGMSNKKNLSEVKKRIRMKYRIYKNNGYRGILYYLDTFFIEFGKYFF